MTKCVGFFGVCLSIVAILATPRTSLAIDFYEIEIYDTDTTPAGHLQLELHSNTTSTATGQLAKSQIDVYQVHETVEATYGVLKWLEVGQYFCTAKLSNGDYEYSGSRTKVHFGIPQTFEWPVQFGGNVELDYMRHAAEENPTALELRPIAGANYKRFRLVGNFAFIDPFSGPGAHHGFQFDPSGMLVYQLNRLGLAGGRVLRRHRIDSAAGEGAGAAAFYRAGSEFRFSAAARAELRRGNRIDTREQRDISQIDCRLDVLILEIPPTSRN